MPIPFDLAKYVRNSKALPVEDLDWDSVAEHPLTAGEVRFLKYMMNIEAHTIVYLRELLSTKAIEDPDVAAFLSCWAYEEHHHGAALERFLKAYVGPAEVSNDAAYRLRQTSRTARVLKAIVTPVAFRTAPDFVAVHMTWGATQELTTLHGYESLARQTNHPMLKELMARIVKDERRHFAFYYNQAERRLIETPKMERINRWTMDRLWRPVGVGAMPSVESDFSTWFLFRGPLGRAALEEIEATMGQLPGMAAWNGPTRRLGGMVDRVAADASMETWATTFQAPAQRLLAA